MANKASKKDGAAGISKTVRKRLITVLAVLLLSAGLMSFCFRYMRFVSGTIYSESAAHLTEIYHQANQSLHNMVDRKWRSMRMWTAYIRDASSEQQLREYIDDVKDEAGFTDFYFISGEGNYRTIDGKTGYLDMKENLPELILHRKDVALTSVVPGQPQIIIFAIPAYPGSYEGFDYEAIAISFNNSDMVDTLKITAFDGQSDCFVIHADGRVIMDSTGDTDKHIGFYNFLALLRERSDMSNEEITALYNDFQNGGSGTQNIYLDGVHCYLNYESVGFEDWIVIGIVPADVVNAGMNRLQTYTLALVGGITVLLGMILLGYVLRQNHLKLKQKDTEILYREELFSTLSVHVDDVFLMLDAKGFRADYISPNIEKLLGIPKKEARANIYEIVSNMVDVNAERVSDVIAGIQPGQQGEWNKEYVHKKTGELRWFHVVVLCRNIRNERKYIVVLSDRTKDMKTNQALKEAVDAAQSASRAKSTFLSNMSHDIRTPMNAIIGYATLVCTHADDAAKVRNYVDKILTSGNHLLSLINGILDMSQIERGKIHLEEQEANLSDMLHDIKTMIGSQVQAKGLKLCMDVGGVTDEEVFCDRTRFTQILLNLLSNAIKFTPSGGAISLRIAQLHDAPEGCGLYEIRILDTGIGLSDEFVARIFEPFEREQSSTVSRIQGTGLGMAISRSIIRLMDGSIEVRTKKNQGTELIVRLPLRLREHSGSAERSEGFERYRVLIADDDACTLNSLSGMLTKMGLRFDAVRSGKEALLLAECALKTDDIYRIYIICCCLPDMNGADLAEQLRTLDGGKSGIIMTACDRAEMEEDALSADIPAFCVKPIFLSDLRKALAIASGKRQTEESTILPSSESKSDFSGKRLLLVEDNDLNREIATEMLREYGFSVDTAQNGAEALEKISVSTPGQYHAVLMDIQMPIMDGYRATREIRALADRTLAEIPILAMTAGAFEEDRKAAAACGVNGFISKPVNIKEMLRVFEELFS